MTSNVSFTMKRGTVKSSSPQTALVCSSFSLKKLIWIDKTRKTSLDGSYFRSVVFSEHAIPFTKDPFYDVDVQEATFLHDETRSIFSETTDGPVIHLTSMLVRTWVRSWRSSWRYDATGAHSLLFFFSCRLRGESQRNSSEHGLRHINPRVQAVPEVHEGNTAYWILFL